MVRKLLKPCFQQNRLVFLMPSPGLGGCVRRGEGRVSQKMTIFGKGEQMKIPHCTVLLPEKSIQLALYLLLTRPHYAEYSNHSAQYCFNILLLSLCTIVCVCGQLGGSTRPRLNAFGHVFLPVNQKHWPLPRYLEWDGLQKGGAGDCQISRGLMIAIKKRQLLLTSSISNCYAATQEQVLCMFDFNHWLHSTQRWKKYVRSL